MAEANDHNKRGTEQSRLDEALQRFENAWRLGSPEPNIDAYLLPGDLRTLADLVHVDLEIRIKLDQNIGVEDYLRRYPALREDTNIVLDLIAQEYELRRRGKPGLTVAEYIERFPEYREQLKHRFAGVRPPEADGNRTGKNPVSDRNLLFGILALQMDFVSRDALLVAMQAWVFNKSKSLGQILREQKALGEEEDKLLEALVRKHLERHDNDPEKSLAAVSSVGSVKEDLQQIADPDLQHSLVHISQASKGDLRSEQTRVLADPACAAALRFRILRPHASGGIGEVFVARDEELRREVALKQIKEVHADNPESRTRFLLEAEVTGGLEHPGIVPVYGLGQYGDGRPFYVMRFIRGDSLRAAIERFHKADVPGRDPGERAIALRQMLGRFIDVCNAIEYAHSRGVLHRDLKPGNIMLGKYGETLVVDWGLAKAIGRRDESASNEESMLRPSTAADATLTQLGSTLGTPAYMSPEQAAGRMDEMGPASDVYSLGATLYCLLTGKAPFTDSDMGMVLSQVRLGEFPAPRKVKSAIPPALEAICLKAMALRPESRYPSPRGLADDIEHWLADEPVSAWREPWTIRSRRWLARHKIVVTGAAGILLITLLGLGFGLAWEREAKRKETLALQEARRKSEEATAQRHEAEQQRDVAERERNTAEKHRKEAERQRDTASKERQIARDRLVQQWVANGVRLQENDATGSLLWFVEALRNNEGNPDTEKILRTRLGIAFRELPKPIRVWKGSTAAINAVFTPDGKRFLLKTDASVRLWDIESAMPATPPIKLSTNSVGVRLSPDGRIILIFANSGPFGGGHLPNGPCQAQLWDAATAKPIGDPIQHAKACRVPVFSPDSRLVALPFFNDAKEDGEVKILNTSTGRPVCRPVEHRSLTGWERNICFSPDGRTFATVKSTPAKGAHEIWLWNTATGDAVGPPLKHEMAASPRDGLEYLRLTFVAGGTRLVSWNLQNAILWDLSQKPSSATYLARYEKESPTSLQDLDPTLDIRKTRIACVARESGKDLVRVWESGTGKLICTIQDEGWLTAFAISPDGSRVVTNFGGDFRAWSADTGKPLSEYRIQLRDASSGDEFSYSANGRRLLLARHGGGEFEILEPSTFSRIFSFRGAANNERVTIAPEARHMIVASGTRVTLFEFSPPSAVVNLPVAAEETSKGGTMDGPARHAVLVRNNICELVDLTVGTPVRRLLKHEGVTLAVFSPDGSRLVTLSGGNAYLYGFPNGYRRQRAEIILWDTATGKLLRRLVDNDEGFMGQAEFSRDNRVLMTVSASPGTKRVRIKLWEAASGMPIAFDREEVSLAGNELQGHFLSAKLHPAAKTVLTVNTVRQIRLWDARTAQPVGPALSHPDNGYGAVTADFTPDGRRFLTINQSPASIQVWDAESCQPITSLLKPFGEEGNRQLNDVTLSPDGKYFATSGESVRIWEVATCRAVTGYLSLYSGGRVSFSPDSRILIANTGSGFDLWDVHTGQPLLRNGFRTLNTLAFSSGEGKLTTIDNRGLLRIWDMSPDPRPVEDLSKLAQLVAGRKLDATGVATALGDRDFQSLSEDLRKKYPHTFVGSPNDATAWHRSELAESQQRQEWSAAIFHANHLIHAEPNNTRYYLERARAYLNLKKFNDAIVDCSKVIQLLPRHYEGWLVRATTHFSYANDLRLEKNVPSLLHEWDLGTYDLVKVMELLPQSGEFPSPAHFNTASWSIVSQPDGGPERYALALGFAEFATRGSPGNGNILNTLGVAQYRAGKFKQAAETLTESEKLNTVQYRGPHPDDLAFLAMAHHQLDHKAKAQETLKRFQDIMKPVVNPKPRAGFAIQPGRDWASDKESQQLLREAEALINGKLAEPKK